MPGLDRRAFLVRGGLLVSAAAVAGAGGYAAGQESAQDGTSGAERGASGAAPDRRRFALDTSWRTPPARRPRPTSARSPSTSP
jgi:hypothetical protein